MRKYPIELKGKFYNNLSSITDDFNIPVKRLESRLKIGFKLEDAVINSKFLTRKKTNKGFTQTIPELSIEHNIKPSKVYCRLNRGWSLKEALELKEEN